MAVENPSAVEEGALVGAVVGVGNLFVEREIAYVALVIGNPSAVEEGLVRVGGAAAVVGNL